MNTLKLPAWLSWIIAICSGLVLPLAFAPSETGFVAVITIAVLFMLIQGQSVKRAALIGWLFGLGYFGIGVSWVYHSIHLFGEAIAPLAALITLVFVLVMTVFPALCCGLWVRCASRLHPVAGAFVFAALWVLSEALRGNIMGGFPWILIGYSQTSGPLGHLAAFIGAYGLSFLVVLLSALLAVVIFARPAARLVAFPLTFVLLLGGLGLKVVEFSEPVGEPLNIRLVQGNIPQETKFSRERLIHALELYTSMTVEQPLDGMDLVIWPETAIPTYYDRVSDYLAPFAMRMDAAGVDVLSGVFVREGENRDRVYNAVRQLGGQQSVYRKRHLVPFGEYMPLRFVFDYAAQFVDIPMSDLAADTRPHEPIDIQGVAVGVSICYEDVYGEKMRAVLPESQLLVNVSNDAWFGRSAAPHQHEQKARMRAREFERPLVRVTNTGISSAMTYRGEILGRIAHDETGIFDVRIQPRSGATLYARTGNTPVFVLALLCVLLAVIVMYRRELQR